jgi:hypothetical protein
MAGDNGLGPGALGGFCVRGKQNADRIAQLRHDHDKLDERVETDRDANRTRWETQKEWNIRMELGGSRDETAKAIAQAVAEQVRREVAPPPKVNLWAYWKLAAAAVLLLLAAGPLAFAATLVAIIGPKTIADIVEACK